MIASAPSCKSWQSACKFCFSFSSSCQLQGGGAPSENFKQLQEKLDVCEKDKKKYAEAEHKVRVELNRANAENANLREDLTGTTHQINQLHYQVRRGCGLGVGGVCGYKCGRRCG